MGPFVKLIWLTTISILLLGVSVVWFYKEFNPEWKQCQRAELNANAALKGKKLEIKQILLKGEGLWANQENGPRVDRCMTCHIDEDKLVKLHPKELPIPYDVYGCTVCHGGNGMFLDTERAHEHMLVNADEMREARDGNADALIKLWTRLAELNPEKEIRLRRESFFGSTGERLLYVGDDECVGCHKKRDMHPEHVKRWSETKFKTFERIKEAPDYKAGDKEYKKQCNKCHTTGYREDKGIYAAEGVGCEACHGPGEVYSYLMQGFEDDSQIEEGQKMAKASFDYNICGDCHVPNRHEMRPKTD